MILKKERRKEIKEYYNQSVYFIWLKFLYMWCMSSSKIKYGVLRTAMNSTVVEFQIIYDISNEKL